VLEEVLRRYEPRTLAAVAERIRSKIGRGADPRFSDGAFLDAYYVALRGPAGAPDAVRQAAARQVRHRLSRPRPIRREPARARDA